MQIKNHKKFAHKTALTVVGLLLLTTCRPSDKEMLVATTRGDVFSDIQPRIWRAGEVQQCRVASQWNTSVQPDDRGDLLLCGDSVLSAWSQGWIRKDVKNRIYALAEKRPVHFPVGIGHQSDRWGLWWSCIRRSEQIECK